MLASVWGWLVTTFSAAGIIAGAGYVCRDPLARFFSKIIETRFEKQMETFKADLRDKENELGQIMSFLVSARRERDSAFQAKRLEAAEILLRLRQAITQLSTLVEYMKILNTDEMLKRGNDKAIADFVKTLIQPFDIDAKLKSLGEINRTLPLLYLSDDTLTKFNIYESIVMSAVMMMQIYTITLPDKKKLIKNDIGLSAKIAEILPATREEFEKRGEGYAYYWSQYFYDEILKSLRNEVSGGSDDISRDAKSIEQLAVDSRRAQLNARMSIQNAGLPETLIKADDFPVDIPAAVSNAPHQPAKGERRKPR